MLGACGLAWDNSEAHDKAVVAEIRAAEARLVAHLEGPDRLAWVGDYAEDAVFQEGEDPPVSGRAALTEVARSLGPLSGAAIEPVRTVVEGNLAYVQVRARYAVGQGASAGPLGHYRGVMIWRKDSDGVWRMLHEMLVREGKPTA
uniref:YybH family protein n=1 Tax=Altererythrobacter segetis TaxID=1104773 RepID=UPI003C2F8FAE